MHPGPTQTPIRTRRTRTSLRWSGYLVMLSALSTGCGEDSAVEGLTVPLACENDALPGYVHTFAASRFDLGEPVTYEVDSQSERWIGPRGTFAARRGSSRAISKATSPALERPGLVPVAVHENETVTYFTDRGLDPAQIANVGNNSLISGVSGNGADADAEFVAFYSSLSRAWNGIPIADSVASARFNDARQSVSESVFWPEIPCEVLDAAEVIRDDIARPDSFLLARVEEALGPEFNIFGTAIRHASRDRPDGDAFTAHAVLAVGQLQTRYEFDLNGELIATTGPRSGPSE